MKRLFFTPTFSVVSLRSMLNAARRGNLIDGQLGKELVDQVFAQDWNLDALGNWSGFDEDADGDGTADLAQRREHNAANELGAITAAVAADWADCAHYAAGNMTAFAQPGAPGVELRARMRSTQRCFRSRAVEALPDLPLSGDSSDQGFAASARGTDDSTARKLAPNLVPATGKSCKSETIPDNSTAKRGYRPKVGSSP